MHNIPTSLYIHFPWCVQKCPYCDFNSHSLKTELDEQRYIQALLADFDAHQLATNWHSVFMGGGTPSLFSANAIGQVIQHVNANCEITLEANPGTTEQQRFVDYRKAGVNRLSIGIQSFDDTQLKALGRIHDSENAKLAITQAKQAGFDNFNIDIMYGLIQQTPEQALQDLTTAISFDPPHISWYQLAIEPNTLFAVKTPKLPDHDTCWEIQQAGQELLAKHGYQQYEVSAYARDGKQCQHNLNYWQFGDYLGIGAGAHSKLTLDDQVVRIIKQKHPAKYLQQAELQREAVEKSQLPFEFMLNALRLMQPISVELFEARTGCALQDIKKTLQHAHEKGLIVYDEKQIETTELGKQYLNELTEMFLS